MKVVNQPNFLTTERPLQSCRECGSQFERKLNHGPFDIQVPTCNCQEIKAKQEADKYQRDHWLAKLKSAGIPKKLLRVNFERYPGEASFATKVQEYSKEQTPGLLILVGEIGTGKSGLAVSAAKEITWADESKTLKYFYAYDLLISGVSFEERKGTLKEVLAPDVVIIDELGIQLDTPPARAFLERVLIGRHEEEKATILISNLEPEKFWALLGERVEDRIKKTGKRVVFDGINIRGIKPLPEGDLSGIW